MQKRQHGSLNKQYLLLPYSLQAKDNGVEIDAMVKVNSFHKSISYFQKHSGNLNQNLPFKGKSDDCMGSLSTHAKQQLGKAGVSAFYF